MSIEWYSYVPTPELGQKIHRSPDGRFVITKIHQRSYRLVDHQTQQVSSYKSLKLAQGAAVVALTSGDVCDSIAVMQTSKFPEGSSDSLEKAVAELHRLAEQYGYLLGKERPQKALERAISDVHRARADVLTKARELAARQYEAGIEVGRARS